MLTKDDVTVIRDIAQDVVDKSITKAVAPLVTKEEAKKTEQMLAREIKKQHKLSNEILGYLVA